MSRTLLLKSMEQTPLYNTVNFDMTPDYGFGVAANSTAVGTIITAYLCPSDPNSGAYRNNNYHACYGTTTHGFSNTTRLVGNGMFAAWSTYGPSSVTDGLSQTIAFSEALVGSTSGGTNCRGNTVSMGGTRNDIVDARADLTGVNALLSQCAQSFQAGSATVVNDLRGARWASGRTGWTMFNALQTPNDSPYRFNGCRVGCVGCGLEAGFSFPATSQHSGGVNVLMGDGSARFVKDSVDRNTWYSLSSRDGAEIVSSDGY
ncbi:prepilin-type processing-associated H-X9-DG domain-containing protein [Singulisphaera sp. GP187]|uniref:DUF1559 family PulG-like putative transporter n=1 Tax=Singulisphaera sp. GP187 TaxID=1882752 RepID=UPI000926E771|nr:DUF1559 domain-containing protein [Singulisphaera sp. GP187]SIO64680.1 prepilin-type processing-associated H-X9-DG domain-containing protein [Singulisphaera sp. GP187]